MFCSGRKLISVPPRSCLLGGVLLLAHTFYRSFMSSRRSSPARSYILPADYNELPADDNELPADCNESDFYEVVMLSNA